MATIEARGYVNRPLSKTTKTGAKFSTYTLAVQQKNKVNGDLVITRAYFDVTDWKAPEPPAESAYVTVSGYFNVRNSEKDGKKYTNLEINAQKVEIAPPKPGFSSPTSGSGAKPGALAPSPAPWDDF